MITINYDNFYTEIDGVSKELYHRLRDSFKFENDFKERLAIKRARGFMPPQFSYLITPHAKKNTLLMFSGLLEKLKFWLDNESIPYQVVYNPKHDTTLPSVEKAKKMVEKLSKLDPPISLRPYQKGAIFASMKYHRGIFYLATGLGKTAVLASMLLLHDRRTLVLCQSIDLAYQLVEEIEFYTGMTDIGFIGNGKFEPTKITVGILQSFSLKKKKGKTKKAFVEYLNSIEAIFVDECHNAQANSYQTLLENIPNCVLRYGFSATPFTSAISTQPKPGQTRGEKQEYNILLEAMFGPYLYKMSTIDGINQGYLARPTINIIENKIDRKTDILQEYNYEYEQFIVKDEQRNGIICKVVSDSFQEGKRVVVFITRLDHGEALIEKLESLGIDRDEIAYVNGQLPKDERKDLFFGFKEKSKNIIIGTVLKEGLNFQCDVGINAAGGDSRRTAIQSLGRILRKQRDPELNDVNTAVEEHVEFYEFRDVGHPFFAKHSKQRIECYKNESHKIVEEKKK